MEISTFCVFKFLSFACFVEKIGVCLENKTEFYRSHFLLATSKKFHLSILKRKNRLRYAFSLLGTDLVTSFSPAAPPTEFVTKVIFLVLAYFGDFSGRLLVNQVSDTNSSRHSWFILSRCLFLHQ